MLSLCVCILRLTISYYIYSWSFPGTLITTPWSSGSLWQPAIQQRVANPNESIIVPRHQHLEITMTFVVISQDVWLLLFCLKFYFWLLISLIKMSPPKTNMVLKTILVWPKVSDSHKILPFLRHRGWPIPSPCMTLTMLKPISLSKS